MDLPLAEEFVKNLQISKDQIVREEYEVLFLRDIFGSTFGPQLVFKGGTALRLAYGAPRFSDNLDFTALTSIQEKVFVKFIQNLARRYQNVLVAEVRKKRFTLFALLKIQEEFLKLPLGVKIEISTRPVAWRAGRDYEVCRLTSPVSNLVVVGKTATLARMWQDKQAAVKTRSKSRDLYDLWYLSGRLGKKFVLPKGKILPQQLKADLNRVLPKSEHYVTDFILTFQK